ncbi:uncharacterized protein PFL1_02907 [Pseudozyma flocculosa PF-1]|uniref:Uncharacterized protein n=2 Tax=Pseudozyma flocculosa TaxID=84751 RepID=A0A5C3F486_9BASI|nr:uncharacterized protein PFL1_02907 [Pseudozyma flocculosa PF-1]EPQ29687.1 hypothetical protein PFL1_02907 [Pseudozyma flocculosa PF-1]SPO38259.1 uncharacterized protein PSFLO_03736 [Pseudozyma flocculosa]
MSESYAQAAANGTALEHHVPDMPNGTSNGGSASKATATPASPSAVPSSTSRYSRVANLSKAINGVGQHHLQGSADGAADKSHASSPFASGFVTPVGQTIQFAAHRAEEALQRVAQEQRDQPAGKVAQWLIDAAHRLQQRLQDEVFSRTNAIGGLDNMWLLIDNISAFNPVCTATYTFQDRVDADRIRQKTLDQIDAFPKYRQRLADAGRLWHGALFVDDPDFDINRHVHVKKLPGDAGPKELEAFVSEFIAQPWDFERPLWEYCVLENYNDPDTGAGCAAVVRGHHSLSDGQGFVMSQLFITSLGPKIESMMSEGAQLLSDARRGVARPSRINKSLKPLDRFHGTLLLQLLMLALYWFNALIGLGTDLAGSFTMIFTTGFYAAMTFWRQRYVTASYAGPRKYEKEFSRSAAFPLSDVKRISKAFSGAQPGSWTDRLLPGKRRSSHPTFVGHHLTVNDVVCTIIADVINDELDRRPDEPGAWEAVKRLARKVGPNPIGIMIPISIRSPGDWSMKNLSTGSIAYLPTTKGLPRNAKSMHRRLHASRRGLNVLKNSLLPKLAFYGIQLTGQLPVLFPVPFGLLPAVRWNPLRPISRLVTEFVLCSFTAVVTNVPCPSRRRIKLAGQEVVQWTASPPQAGKGTLGIGICSYAGEVSVCITADRVEGSLGVARRLTQSFEKRWRDYVDVAEAVIQEAEGGGGGGGSNKDKTT